MSRRPIVVPPNQRRRIRRGKKQIARGEFVTLDALDRSDRAKRRKGR